MITPFSLQTLVDISRHPTLGPCMTHLIIGLDYFKAIPPVYISRPEDYAQCKLAADVQDSLLDTGLAMQLFSTAFLNLRNLENVDVRDFTSPTRYRDAGSHQSLSGTRFSNAIPAWKSYGYSHLTPWSQYLDEEGSRRGLSVRLSQGQSFADRVFKVLVAALGQSGSHVRGLEVLSRHRHMALSDGAFAVNPILDMADTQLPSVLSGLDKLHLDFDVTQSSLTFPYRNHFSSDSVMPESAQEICDPTTANLRRLLGLTANLTWLRLNDVGSDAPPATRLLFWLALDPEKPLGLADEACWSDINPKPVSLPLRRLDLGRMKVDLNTLELILRKFDKLESLSLRNITLHEPNYIQQSIADDANGASTWTRLFRELPAFAPNLKHLLLGHLSQQETMHWETQAIVFGTPVMGSQVWYRLYTEELHLIDQASLDSLAGRTWTMEAWSTAHQIDCPSDSHRSSLGNEHDDSSEIDSLFEIDEDASENGAD